MPVEIDDVTAAQRHREQAVSFGPAAALYDSVRPSYPRDAVHWALAPLGPGRIGDVGAGTGAVSYGPLFGDVEWSTFRHSTRHTPGSLVRLMQSRSYYLTSSTEQQRDLEREVLELTRSHPDLAGRHEFEVPYATSVYRAVRRDL